MIRQQAQTRVAEGLAVHFQGSLCPLQGKRAPELAVGKIKDVVGCFFQKVLADVLVEHPVALEPSQLQILLNDSQSAQSHMQLQLYLKLDMWRRVPWLLAGVGHWDSTLARACADKAVTALQQQDQDDAFDSFTKPWLKEPLWSSLKQFAEGYGGAFMTGLPFKIQANPSCIVPEHACLCLLCTPFQAPSPCPN